MLKLLLEGSLIILSTFTARSFRLDLLTAEEVSAILNQLQILVEKDPLIESGDGDDMMCKG